MPVEKKHHTPKSPAAKWFVIITLAFTTLSVNCAPTEEELFEENFLAEREEMALGGFEPNEISRSSIGFVPIFPPGRDDHGDNIFRATPIPFDQIEDGVRTNGVITGFDDHDYFRITVPSGVIGRFSVYSMASESIYGDLLDGRGNVIISDMGSGEGPNFAISQNVEGPVTLYVNVRPGFPLPWRDTRRPYQIETTFTSNTGHLTINNTSIDNSPFEEGTIDLSGEFVYGLFDQNANGYVDSVGSAPRNCPYPMTWENFFDDWSLHGCSGYPTDSEGRADIAITAVIDTDPNSIRPQFVTLFFDAVVPNPAAPRSFWPELVEIRGGDLNNDASTDPRHQQGVVMTSWSTVWGIVSMTNYSSNMAGELPYGEAPGFLRGWAEGRIHYVPPSGHAYSADIVFNFDVSLWPDTVEF